VIELYFADWNAQFGVGFDELVDQVPAFYNIHFCTVEDDRQ